MDPETADAIAEQLAGAGDYLPRLAHFEDRERHLNALAKTLELVPQPEGTLVRPGDTGARALLLAGDRLFSCEVETGLNDPVEPTWTVTGYRLADATVSRFSEAADTRFGAGTRSAWEFRFPDAPAVIVEGSVYGRSIHQHGGDVVDMDEAEDFARRVAGRSGWTVTGG